MMKKIKIVELTGERKDISILRRSRISYTTACSGEDSAGERFANTEVL